MAELAWVRGTFLFAVVNGPVLEQRTIREVQNDVALLDEPFQELGHAVPRRLLGTDVFDTPEAALKAFANKLRLRVEKLERELTTLKHTGPGIEQRKAAMAAALRDIDWSYAATMEL